MAEVSFLLICVNCRDCASAAGRAKRAHSVAASTTGRSSRQQIHEAGAVPKYLTRRKEK